MNKKGNSLIMALILVVIMMGIIAAFFSPGIAYNRSLQTAYSVQMARNAAESGIHASIAEINRSRNIARFGAGKEVIEHPKTRRKVLIDFKRILGNVKRSDAIRGHFTSVVAYNEDNDTYLVISQGKHGKISKTIEALLEPAYTAIFGKPGLCSSNSTSLAPFVVFDSVDSHKAQSVIEQVANEQTTNRGGIASNGKIRIGRKAAINGNIVSTYANTRVKGTFITIGSETIVKGNVRSNSGDIRAGRDLFIQKDLTSYSGEIKAGAGTVVDGLESTSGPWVSSIDFHVLENVLKQEIAAFAGNNFNKDAFKAIPGVNWRDVEELKVFGSKTLSKKEFVFKSIIVNSNAKLIFPKDVTIFVLDSFHIKAKASLHFKKKANIFVADGSFITEKKSEINFDGKTHVQAKKNICLKSSEVLFKEDVNLVCKKKIILGEKKASTNIAFEKAAIIVGNKLNIREQTAIICQSQTNIDAKKQIKIKKGATIVFNSNTVIDTPKLEIEQGAIIDNNGITRAFVASTAKLLQQTTALHPKPTNFLVYVYGNKEEEEEKDFIVKLPNKGAFFGAIYAPRSLVKLHRGISYYGAIVAHTLRVDRGAKFYYDEALGLIKQGKSNKYRLTAYRESFSKSFTHKFKASFNPTPKPTLKVLTWGTPGANAALAKGLVVKISKPQKSKKGKKIALTFGTFSQPHLKSVKNGLTVKVTKIKPQKKKPQKKKQKPLKDKYTRYNPRENLTFNWSTLLEDLSKGSLKEKSRAKKEILKKPKEATSLILTAVSNPQMFSNNLPLLRELIYLLQKLKMAQKAVPGLLLLVKDNKNPSALGKEALKVLVELKSFQATLDLMTVVKSKNNFAWRLQVLKSLILLRDPRCLPFFLDLMLQHNALLAYYAHMGFAKFSSAPIVGDAGQAILEKLPRVPKTIKIGLLKLFSKLSFVKTTQRQKAIDIVTSSILWTHPNAALELLGALEAKEQFATIIEHLENNDIVTQTIAVKALGNLKLYKSVPLLLPFLKSHNAKLQQTTHSALQYISGQKLALDYNLWQQWWAFWQKEGQDQRDKKIEKLFTILEKEYKEKKLIEALHVLSLQYIEHLKHYLLPHQKEILLELFADTDVSLKVKIALCQLLARLKAQWSKEDLLSRQWQR